MVSVGDIGFFFLGLPFGIALFSVAIEVMGYTCETIGFACKAVQTPYSVVLSASILNAEIHSFGVINVRRNSLFIKQESKGYYSLFSRSYSVGLFDGHYEDFAVAYFACMCRF